MKVLYPAKIENAEEGGYVVTFPDFAEAVTQADTLEEALFNASEVLTLTIEGRMSEGMDVPHPKKKSGKGFYFVAPAARVQGALLFKMSRGKLSISDIARTLGTSWAAASKLEDPRHSPTLKQLEKAVAATGKKLVLDVE